MKTNITLDKVKLNRESALSIGNWASRPITNSVVLNKLGCANQRKKVYFATETFLFGL